MCMSQNGGQNCLKNKWIFFKNVCDQEQVRTLTFCEEKYQKFLLKIQNFENF